MTDTPMPTALLSVRVDAHTLAQLDAIAATHPELRHRSDVVRAAIDRYLDTPPLPVDRQQASLDLILLLLLLLLQRVSGLPRAALLGQLAQRLPAFAADRDRLLAQLYRRSDPPPSN